MSIYFDIETIGTENQAVIDELTLPIFESAKAEAESVKPPANYKSQDVIDKWWAESGEAKKAATLQEAKVKADEAVKQTAFDGGYGRIICIGYAFGNDDVKTIVGNERDILVKFFLDLTAHAALKFIGHNIANFDLPFLHKRAIVLGIKPPELIPFGAKPWDTKIGDTMQMWDAQKRTSLDKLCKILGIESPKGDMTGADVWDAFRLGKIDEIAAYCAKDVHATRTVYKRIVFGGR